MFAAVWKNGWMMCAIAMGMLGLSATVGRASDEDTATVQAALRSRATLRSMTGRGAMRIIDKPNKFRLTVNFDAWAESPQKLKINATKFGQSMQAFDALLYGEHVYFYIPREQLVFRGTLADITGEVVDPKTGEVIQQNTRSGLFDPSDLLNRLFGFDPTLLTKRWRKAGSEKRGLFSRRVEQYQEVVAQGQPYMMLEVHPMGVVTRVQRYSAKGQLVFDLTYEKYTDLAMPSGNATKFPRLMQLDWPEEGLMVRVVVKEIQPNVAVERNTWRLNWGEGVRVLPLSKLAIEPDQEDEQTDSFDQIE